MASPTILIAPAPLFTLTGDRNTTPVWDGARRELRLGAIVVKRFRQPAKNLETILAAFQEDAWPPRIDDPLPGGDNVDPRERLHNAVKRLNQQKVRLIRFQCDGTGQGILWELVN
jgi:hypothetical protein